MNSNNKESPKAGEYIDLKNGDFKKKSNVLRNIIFIIFFIFLGSIIGYFINYEKILLLPSNKISERLFGPTVPTESKENISKNQFRPKVRKESYPEISESSVVKNLENKLDKYIQINEKLENDFEKLLINNSALTQQINSLKEITSKTKITASTFDNDTYLNFLKFRFNFLNKKNFLIQLNRLYITFEEDAEAQSILRFFENFNSSIFVDRTEIYEKLDEKIYEYESDIELFAKKVEDNENFELEKIIESKENFKNYLKHIFTSTFKISKFKEKAEVSTDLKRVFVSNLLSKTKEYILLSDLKVFINKIEAINLNDEEINLIIKQAKLLNEVEINLKKLEEKILNIPGKKID